MKLKVYYVSVILIAAVCVSASFMSAAARDVPVILVMGALAFLAETMAFQLPLAGSVSLGFAIGFAALLYDGPTAAAMVALMGSISIQDIRSRRPWLLQVFNSAQLAIAILASATTYIALGGTPLAWPQGHDALGAGSLIAALAAASVFFVVNILLVGQAVALRSEMPLTRVLKEQSFAAYWVSLVMLALLGLVLAQLLSVSSWVAVLLLVAPFAIARQTFRVYLELSSAYADTVRSLVRAIEAKDPYTRGHSERVAVYSRALARGLGMTASLVDRIEIAALLHDIGKIGIPESTLGKKGKLTKEEISAIREHPSKGMMVLAEVESLSDIINIVHAHHERPDGTGYPRGLRRDEIPLEARILAVADTYDAMTSDRPYRAALSEDEAAQELRAVSGSQLDSSVVITMLDYLTTLPNTPVLEDAH